jgi:hypothetical protein
VIFVVIKTFTKSRVKARGVSSGGGCNVRRENDLGNTSDRRIHDVYSVILLPFVCDDPLERILYYGGFPERKD